MVGTLQDRGDAEAAGRADRDQTARGPVGLRELLGERSDDPPAGGPEWVAGTERATVDVELGAIDRPERLVASELLRAERRVLPCLEGAEDLSGERLVDLVGVEVLQREPGAV